MKLIERQCMKCGKWKEDDEYYGDDETCIQCRLRERNWSGNVFL